MFGMLLSLLARPRTAGELAEKYEMSTRSVYRYLDALEMGGVPLMRKQGRDGGFYLDSAHFIDKCYFTDAELSAAISLLRTSAVGNATVTSVADKLEGLSGMKNDASYALKPANLVIDTGSWFAPADNSKVALINAAIDACNVLRLTYCDAYGNTSEREVEPHTLVFKDGVWYLYGYCHLRNDWRMFHLNGITECVPLSARFERKTYDTKNSPWRTLPDSTEGVDCVLSFDDALREDIAEKFGASNLDGNTLRFRSAITPRLVATLASYGAHLRVVSPESLRNDIKTFFANALAAQD